MEHGYYDIKKSIVRTQGIRVSDNISKLHIILRDYWPNDEKKGADFEIRGVQPEPYMAVILEDDHSVDITEEVSLSIEVMESKVAVTLKLPWDCRIKCKFYKKRDQRFPSHLYSGQIESKLEG